jgi:MFS family permease
MRGAAILEKNVQIPATIKRITIELVVAYLFNFIGFTLLLSTLSLLGKNLLAGIAGNGAAGLPMTILSGVAIASALPFASMANRLGRKPAIIIMIVCYALGDVLGLIGVNGKSGVIFLCSMVILGIGVGAMALFATAVTDLYPAKFKGRASGFAQMGIMGANVVGYFVGSLMVSAMGTTSVYILGACAQVVAIVLILSLKKDPRDIGKDLKAYWPEKAFSQAELAPVVTKQENVQKGRSVFSLLTIWPLLLSIFLRIFIHLGTNFVNMALPLAFTELGYSLSVIGIFMTLRALGSFVAATQTGQLIDKFGRKLGFISAPVATIIGILLVGMTTNIVCIVVGVIVIGVGNAVANVVPPAVANDVTTIAERSTAVAIFGISTNIGGFIFPVPMALVLAKFGLSGLAIACGVFLLIPTVLGIFVKETAATKVKA